MIDFSYYVAVFCKKSNVMKVFFSTIGVIASVLTIISFIMLFNSPSPPVSNIYFTSESRENHSNNSAPLSELQAQNFEIEAKIDTLTQKLENYLASKDWIDDLEVNFADDNQACLFWEQSNPFIDSVGLFHGIATFTCLGAQIDSASFIKTVHYSLVSTPGGWRYMADSTIVSPTINLSGSLNSNLQAPDRILPNMDFYTQSSDVSDFRTINEFTKAGFQVDNPDLLRKGYQLMGFWEVIQSPSQEIISTKVRLRPNGSLDPLSFQIRRWKNSRGEFEYRTFQL